MAVEVVYRSSRDPERLFMDKAEADRHECSNWPSAWPKCCTRRCRR